MKRERVTILKKAEHSAGPVVYWMSRDQRVHDNWALLYAGDLALQYKSPLMVVFCLVPRFLNAALRQYRFMVKGLMEIHNTLEQKNIPFSLLTGVPEKEVPLFLKKIRAGALVTDFDPLRVKREWSARVAEAVRVPFYEVDAHNIVPCRTASPKQEYAAYTIRPKIRRVLPEFMDAFPKLKKHPFTMAHMMKPIDWEKSFSSLKIDHSVPEAAWIKPGERAAKRVLNAFIKTGLHSYEKDRNDPTKDGQSNLSPYLHFGQISAQRVAMQIEKSDAAKGNKEALLEELIIRRELSDNFCFYNDKYDSFAGFPNWARASLDKHRKKRREYLYSSEAFENAETHDDLWNAAQSEMVIKGKMHGYMRMYWAKKILEWTESPEKALEIAIYLNDKYELDGRDPNGYTGIAWSIGGVHDRAWNERRVFGKVRYMSYNGCRGKFDVDSYIQKWRIHKR